MCAICWYPAPVPNQSAGPLMSAEPSRRGRYVPAILDAIIPGVGHLFAGRRNRGLLFLTPILIALAAAVFIGLTTFADADRRDPARLRCPVGPDGLPGRSC